jgi:hypothetical protein
MSPELLLYITCLYLKVYQEMYEIDSETELLAHLRNIYMLVAESSL